MYRGHNVSSILLNYSQSKTVDVVLTPIPNLVTSPTARVPVNIRTSLLNNNTYLWENYTFTPQGAPSVTGHPVGTGIISHYTEDPFLPIELGLIIIAVAVIGGLATIALRGRRKK
jgi:hypothetical protein